MTKIDTSNWGEFVVGDLFDMEPGKRVRKHDQESGDIPFVMASSANQGVVSTIANPITTVENGITVDILGNCYYHPGLVGYGDDNASLKLKKKYSNYETENVYLFLSTILHNIAKHATFKNKLRGSWYVEQTIKLPVNPSNPEEPYWKYMEAFMAEINKHAHKRVQDIQVQSQEQKHPIDTSNWGEFKVGDLFDVLLSDGDNKPQQLNSGRIPLVSSGKTNNGIVGYYDSDTTIFDPGCITADMFGQCFYQPERFQAVSHGRVNILKPKKHIQPYITAQTGLFIATVLNKKCEKYNFTEMLTSKKLEAITIKLPVKDASEASVQDGPFDSAYAESGRTPAEPDWDYMEAFMGEINKQARKRVQELSGK